MYKLIIVSGPNRGASFPLQEGRTVLGRQSGNGIVLRSGKISRQHCYFVVESNGDVVLEDNGSANGTYVNGSLTSGRSLKTGDRISVGEYVLELQHAAQRKSREAPVLIEFNPELSNPVSAAATIENLPEQKKTPVQSAKIFFETGVMPTFYQMATRYELKFVSLGILFAFVLVAVFIAIDPMVDAVRSAVIKESARRASFMAKLIATENAPALVNGNESQTNVSLVEEAFGVRKAMLVDLDSRIIAPSNLLNQYLGDGGEGVFVRKVAKAFQNGKESGIVAPLDGGRTVIAVEAIKALSPNLGKNVVIAMAVVSIDANLGMPDLGSVGVMYGKTLILVCLMGVVAILILYRLNLKPFENLNEELDAALKGSQDEVSQKYKFEELNPLYAAINSAIQRIPRDSGSSKSDASNTQFSAEDFSSSISAIAESLNLATVVLNSSKQVLSLSSEFESISGIRTSEANGQELHSVARDQAFGAFVQDLVNQAESTFEGKVQDLFEFSGVNYRFEARAIGLGVPKAYLLIMTRTEEASAA